MLRTELQQDLDDRLLHLLENVESKDVSFGDVQAATRTICEAYAQQRDRDINEWLLYRNWNRVWANQKRLSWARFDRDIPVGESLFQVFRSLVVLVLDSRGPTLQQEHRSMLRRSLRVYLEYRGIPLQDSDEAESLKSVTGPIHPYTWRHEGTTIDDVMQPAAWRLVEFLWKCDQESASFDEIKEPVYQDPEHFVDGIVAGSLRKAANIFFRVHGLPFRVSLKKTVVYLRDNAE